MSDQVNNTPSDQNAATDNKTNPHEEDKSVAIDSALPKAPVPAVEPEKAPEKERKQA